MDRRDFIKSATTLLVGATMHRSNFAQAAERKIKSVWFCR